MIIRVEKRSNYTILSNEFLIPEKHQSPMVISFVNKAIVDYPAKEVAQAVAYAAGNVRGGRMQFKAYLDKTLKNRWAEGWEPEHDEKQAARQEALAQLKRLPDYSLKLLAEAGNVVARKELNRRQSSGLAGTGGPYPEGPGTGLPRQRRG